MTIGGVFIVNGVSYEQSRRCGYCGGIANPTKNPEETWALDHLKQAKRCPSSSYGFQSLSLSISAYQTLIDRGWRRSGDYVYRNDMLRSCCRHYTIRTSMTDFLQGFYKKEHRHSLNRFYKYFCEGMVPNPKWGLKDKFVNCETSSDVKFKSVLTPAKATKEKYALYKKYQMAVHKDKESDLKMSSFERFLCHDPFGAKKPDWLSINADWDRRESGTALREFRGPMHECYYHVENGKQKLIAMSVLDVLDEAVSAVYFVYDPDYSNLGMGTVSALREICMTTVMDKKWYYLGYYIPDCDKMKYKAKFGGEILDLGHYNAAGDIDNQWWKLRDLGTALDDGKFHTFESVDGKLVDTTEKLFGPTGKYRQFPTATTSSIPSLKDFWSSPTKESAYTRADLKSPVSSQIGPQIVPGCHMFSSDPEEYAEYLMNAVQTIGAFNYPGYEEALQITTVMGLTLFQTKRVLGPDIPAAVLFIS